jgi:glycosyltransferase involved in cell wall biosynthesis
MLGVVPNGIRFEDYFVEDRVRNGVGLIFSGVPVKGPEVAIAVLKGIGRAFPEVPRHTFGSFPRPNGLKSNEYTRYPQVAKAREIYNRCKVWIVTSRDEGFCLPILEAMACGCVVISSRHTNAEELIQDGVNGFTVPYGDVDAYLRLINSLLSDEKLCQRIVQQGLKSVRQFTWKNAATLMEETLHRVNNAG